MRVPKSKSCTRKRSPSIKRNPLPYINFTSNCGVPDIASITRFTSSRVSTVGTRMGRSASTAWMFANTWCRTSR